MGDPNSNRIWISEFAVNRAHVNGERISHHDIVQLSVTNWPIIINVLFIRITATWCERMWSLNVDSDATALSRLHADSAVIHNCSIYSIKVHGGMDPART